MCPGLVLGWSSPGQIGSFGLPCRSLFRPLHHDAPTFWWHVCFFGCPVKLNLWPFTFSFSRHKQLLQVLCIFFLTSMISSCSWQFLKHYFKTHHLAHVNDKDSTIKLTFLHTHLAGFFFPTSNCSFLFSRKQDSVGKIVYHTSIHCLEWMTYTLCYKAWGYIISFNRIFTAAFPLIFVSS